MTTSAKPAITWSWPMNFSSTALTVKSALTYQMGELEECWQWQANSKPFAESQKKFGNLRTRQEWMLQSTESNLYLKDWSNTGPTWTADPMDSMRWLDPEIPARGVQENQDLFGPADSFKLVCMTFPRTSQ
jgi:hypothetical protein